MSLREWQETGAVRHGGSHRDDGLLLSRQLCETLAKNILILRRLWLTWSACRAFGCVMLERVVLRPGEPFALGRDAMHEDRAIEGFGSLEGFDQVGNIVAVDRTNVGE